MGRLRLWLDGRFARSNSQMPKSNARYLNRLSCACRRTGLIGVPRIPEANHGIQSAELTNVFRMMARASSWLRPLAVAQGLVSSSMASASPRSMYFLYRS